MWLITAGCIKLVLPGLSWLIALLIAACTTPTDPVLSNAIVKGAFADQYVPARLRNIISAESGANDGLGYLYLFLALRFLKSPTPGQAIKTLVLHDVLYTVIGAILVGIAIGLAANRALRFACKHNYIDKESFLLYGPMLGLTSIGIGGALGVDDVLTSFIAGNAFTYDDWYRQETEEDEVQNVLDFLLNSLFFSFAGAAVPFATFNTPELGITPSKLLVLAVLVLIFRRLPPVLLLYRYMPAIGDISEAAFTGYFGPMGAGAILYCSLVLHELSTTAPEGSTEWQARQAIRPIIYSLVLASLVGHTLAIPTVKVFFDRRGWHSIQLKATMEEEQDAEGEEGEEEEQEEEYEEGTRTPPEQRHFDTNLRAAQASMEPSHRQDGEMTQPPSSVHPTLRFMGRTDTSGSLRFSRSDIDAAYRAGGSDATGGDFSWRHSSGHKLGPHLAVEHREHGDQRPSTDRRRSRSAARHPSHSGHRTRRPDSMA